MNDLAGEAAMLAYATPRVASTDEMISWSRSGVDGLVLAGAEAVTRAEELRRLGFSGALWADRADYGSAARHSSEELFDTWRLREAPLQLAESLTRPRAVVVAGDLECLRRTIGLEPDAQRALLPLEAKWLSKHAQLLTGELVRHRRPVALALKDAFDPLGSDAAVSGLLHVLRSVDDVTLLRVDVSGLGALAHGARAVAIGVSSTTRHIPAPIRGSKGSTREPPQGADVFVPGLMSHHRAATLQSLAMLGSTQIWDLDRCACSVCGGRSLTRFAFTLDRVQGRAHDMAALRMIFDELVLQGAESRREYWQNSCRASIDCYIRLREEHRLSLRIPPALTAWARLPGVDSRTVLLS